jgi:hypothetical protein
VRADQAALPRRARGEARHGVGAAGDGRERDERLGLHHDHAREAHVVEPHLADGEGAV